MENIIGSAPVEEKKKGFLSSVAIGMGALLGGPFVGGWMLGENFKELGKPELAKKYKIGGIVVFILLIVVASLVDTKSSFGFIAPFVALVLFNRFQKKEIEASLASGGKKRVKWPKVCIVFTVLLYVLVTLALVGGFWADKQLKTQDESMKNGQAGFSLVQEGKYNEAISLFSKNIALDSNDAESYMFRGIAKSQSDDVKGAIEELWHFQIKTTT